MRDQISESARLAYEGSTATIHIVATSPLVEPWAVLPVGILVAAIFLELLRIVLNVPAGGEDDG